VATIFLVKIARFVGRRCRLPRHTHRQWRPSVSAVKRRPAVTAVCRGLLDTKCNTVNT